MKNKSLSLGEQVAVGLMLFALFLGAGNIIFPPQLGQQAGDSFSIAMLGFLITGVGLPLIGVITVAKSGGQLQDLAGKVHPVFGVVFTSIVYLAIGPFFAIPRTGTVSYEIGVAELPFMTDALRESPIPLLISTIVFFGITAFFALNPTKLVDRVGKILTPLLLLVIALLAAKSIITPMDGPGEAVGKYTTQPFTEGFLQGYLTMDFLAALVFGIVIIQALQAKGVTDNGKIVKTTIFAAFIAAAGLALVYISLGYIGASSLQTIGAQSSGAEVIAKSANILYGDFGNILLSAVILLACLSTSIGLLTASSQFFTKIFPKISYTGFVFIFGIFSTVISNFGLAQLISISLPVLLAIYPIAIVLMCLALVDKFFNGAPIVYTVALIATALVSIYDGLKAAKIEIPAYEDLLSHLPLYAEGIGWLVPAIVCTVIGWIISLFTKK
ncbi:branched-chain amino acid transport system II carrier protein [Viridibacillus sp. YIM B01967]|uniref:Branched-chain amino acid transport system carrier protein n=1 Tax=Viridibacillus soli TaxID=2798301 RepID=A0ABS1H5W7_9BACL|nr:branched-chain amino acid transport system II carrier protein [Viridibacillus soli]MBK3494810.1 branched-chain amino acid transport system II carrier protein [Viridibacillus soli]